MDIAIYMWMQLIQSWMAISRKNQSFLHCHSLRMEPAYFLVIGAIWFFYGNLDILTFSHSGILILLFTWISLHGWFFYFYHFIFKKKIKEIKNIWTVHKSRTRQWQLKQRIVYLRNYIGIALVNFVVITFLL